MLTYASLVATVKCYRRAWQAHALPIVNNNRSVNMLELPSPPYATFTVDSWEQRGKSPVKTKNKEKLRTELNQVRDFAFT